jgi:hypothetical protein
MKLYIVCFDWEVENISVWSTRKKAIAYLENFAHARGYNKISKRNNNLWEMSDSATYSDEAAYIQEIEVDTPRDFAE